MGRRKSTSWTGGCAAWVAGLNQSGDTRQGGKKYLGSGHSCWALILSELDGWRYRPDGKNQVTWVHFVEED